MRYPQEFIPYPRKEILGFVRYSGQRSDSARAQSRVAFLGRILGMTIFLKVVFF